MYVKWLITTMKPKGSKQPSKGNGGNHECVLFAHKEICVFAIFSTP